MAVQVKVLVPSKIAEATQTTQYTATNVTTIIDKFTATNYDTSARTISVNLVTALDTAGNQNLIIKTKTLLPAETYTFPEIVGQVLAPGGFISTIASAATATTSAHRAGRFRDRIDGIGGYNACGDPIARASRSGFVAATASRMPGNSLLRG